VVSPAVWSRLPSTGFLRSSQFLWVTAQLSRSFFGVKHVALSFAVVHGAGTRLMSLWVPKTGHAQAALNRIREASISVERAVTRLSKLGGSRLVACRLTLRSSGRAPQSWPASRLAAGGAPLNS